jgi:hypothetical protein
VWNGARWRPGEGERKLTVRDRDRSGAGVKGLDALIASFTVKSYWVVAGDTDFAHDGAEGDFDVQQSGGKP